MVCALSGFQQAGTVPPDRLDRVSRFDSGRRTMANRWVRLVVSGVMFGCATVALALGSPASVPVVEAVDNCDKVIPIEAINDVVVGTGAEAAYATGTAGTMAALDVTAGGATLTAAGETAAVTVGGKIVLGVAAAWGAITGTCKVLDWITGDGDSAFCDAVGPFCDPEYEYVPTATEADMSIGEPYQCRSVPAWSAVEASYQCLNVTMGTAWPNGTRLRSSSHGSFTIGSNTFNCPSVAAGLYYVPCTGAAAGTDVRWMRPDGAATVCTYSSASTCFAWGAEDTTWTMAWYCTAVSAGNWGAVSGVSGTASNVGANCGRPPNMYAVAYNGTTVHGVFNPSADRGFRDTGWSRRIVTDVLCMSPGSPLQRWVRAQSSAYWDRVVDVAVPYPSCLDGEVPVEAISSRVPVGITCNLGAACFGTASVIFSYALPSTTFDKVTGTAPEWALCLAAGGDCGEPAELEEVCQWGGYLVAPEFCTEPTVDTNTLTRTEDPPEPATHSPGTPVDTSTVPDPVDPPPDTGTDVTVPIDPGGGLGSGTIDEGTAECWPTGWGWFNPGQWVLRPIKCAFMWAFIPDTAEITAEWDELYAELEVAVPFAWVIEAYTTVGDSTAGMEAAIASNTEECFSWFAGGFSDEVTGSDLVACPHELASGGGPLEDWAPVRDVAGIGVWLFWLISLGRILFGGSASSEPEQLTLF